MSETRDMCLSACAILQVRRRIGRKREGERGEGRERERGRRRRERGRERESLEKGREEERALTDSLYSSSFFSFKN